MASTLLASTAIMLSSLIAILMTGGAARTNNNDFITGLTFGEGNKLRLTIKFFSILFCFMVSFLMNVQSIRYFSHASMLINVPYRKITNFRSHHLTAEYVGSTVNMGSYFWSLGLRAFYFSFPLFLWLFGAIPMFICSVFMVFMLYFLDITFDLGWVADTSTTDVEAT
ncbi:putative DNA-binding protein BIN4-like protein [Tanacetum coccineum]